MSYEYDLESFGKGCVHYRTCEDASRCNGMGKVKRHVKKDNCSSYMTREELGKLESKGVIRGELRL